ncbi:MAG: hypothetical protein GY730_01080 [bacterium]|nr:hypothetical protein [bacterium]
MKYKKIGLFMAKLSELTTKQRETLLKSILEQMRFSVLNFKDAHSLVSFFEVQEFALTFIRTKKLKKYTLDELKILCFTLTMVNDHKVNLPEKINYHTNRSLLSMSLEQEFERTCNLYKRTNPDFTKDIRTQLFRDINKIFISKFGKKAIGDHSNWSLSDNENKELSEFWKNRLFSYLKLMKTSPSIENLYPIMLCFPYWAKHYQSRTKWRTDTFLEVLKTFTNIFDDYGHLMKEAANNAINSQLIPDQTQLEQEMEAQHRDELTALDLVAKMKIPKNSAGASAAEKLKLRELRKEKKNAREKLNKLQKKIEEEISLKVRKPDNNINAFNNLIKKADPEYYQSFLYSRVADDIINELSRLYGYGWGRDPLPEGLDAKKKVRRYFRKQIKVVSIA